MKEHFRIATKNLLRRRLRSWLTVVGIFLSIAVIFILISLSLGLNAAVQEQFRQLGTDKFFIELKGQAGAPGSGGAVKFTEDDVEAIRKVSGVKAVAFDVLKSVKVELSGESRFVNSMGLPLDKETLGIWIESGIIKIESGRALQSGDSKHVMVGSQYHKNQFFSKQVELGDTLKINGTDFRVVGLLKTLGNPVDDRTVFLPIDELRALYPEVGDRVDQIAIQIETGEDINDVAERVNKRLLNHRGVSEKNKDFIILTPEDLLASFGTILNILTGFLLGVAAISLLVGSIGIANTMYTSVLERTKEIGVMKAVGARNQDILMIFTIEAGLLGLMGGIAGIIVGIIVVNGIEFIAVNLLATTLLQASTPWYLILGCLIFAFLIGSISGAFPAYRASRIKPVDALRYE